MAAVVVSRPALVPRAAIAARSDVVHPKMSVVAEGGVAFTVPYAPNDVTSDGLAPTFDSVDRSGRAPLLLRSGDGLQTMSFDLVFGHPDPQVSIEGELAQLRALAGSGARMVVTLDATSAARRWRLTSFSQQVLSRQHGSNDPTRARCSLVFTEVSDPVVAVGPVSGGAVSGPAAAAAGPVKLPTTHVFVLGDTMAKLAKRYYGDPKLAGLILDANKLRRGSSVITGQKLTIPRKK